VYCGKNNISSVTTSTERFTDLGGQARFGYGGLVFGSSKFSKMPQKMTLALKVVKNYSKIIISLRLTKSMTLSYK